MVPFEVRRTVFGAGGMCVTKVPKCAECHKMGLASFGAKCGYLGRKGRRGRGGGGGQVRCRCMLPSGWVCCGVDRVMFRAGGGKSRNLQDQMENNYLSEPRWLAGLEMAIWRRFPHIEGNKARRRRRNFSKVDFTPFPGLGRQNKA